MDVTNFPDSAQFAMQWAHLGNPVDSPDPTWRNIPSFVRDKFITYLFSDHIVNGPSPQDSESIDQDNSNIHSQHNHNDTDENEEQNEEGMSCPDTGRNTGGCESYNDDDIAEYECADFADKWESGKVKKVSDIQGAELDGQEESE